MSGLSQSVIANEDHLVAIYRRTGNTSFTHAQIADLIPCGAMLRYTTPGIFLPARDRYQTLQEIYDAVREIYDIRSAKLRMAVRDRVVFRRDGERPENLTVEEQERYDMAISLGGHNAAE